MNSQKLQVFLITLPVAFIIMISIGFISCNSGSNSPTNNNANTDTIAFPENFSGGCYPQCYTPAKGETIDLTNGKYYQFAWQTMNGSNCETPWFLYIAGNPFNMETGANVMYWQFSKKEGQFSGNGGYVNLTAANLEGLTSYNGVYHWVIMGWYGSHPNSVAFKIKK